MVTLNYELKIRMICKYANNHDIKYIAALQFLIFNS